MYLLILSLLTGLVNAIHAGHVLQTRTALLFSLSHLCRITSVWPVRTQSSTLVRPAHL